MHLSLVRPRTALAAVAFSGVTAVLSGVLAPAASASEPAAPGTTASVVARTSTAAWFVDPRTPAQRKAQIKVPRKPAAYRGKARETRAVYRTRAGALAVPMRYAFGHQLSRGQAVTLDGAGLFTGGSAKLTRSASAQVTRLAGSLTNAARVRCEGYADYTGSHTRAQAKALSRQRAATVCARLARTNPGLKVSTISYGPRHPAVVGGTPGDRRLNRRVVVQMTGTRPQEQQPKTPGAPVLRYADGGDETITYAYTAPASDGGSPIIRYEVSTGGAWTPVVARHDPGHLTRGMVDETGWIFGILADLPVGSEFDLRVRAVNKVGAGQPSNQLSAMAYGRPSAPTGLTVTGGDGTLTFSFSAPEVDGGFSVHAYEVSYDDGGNWAPVAKSGDAPWTVTHHDLTNGETYRVHVRARNAYGAGPAATGSALVATVPGAPALTGPVLTGNSVALSFTAPAFDGGLAITSYELSTDGGASWNPFVYTPGSGSSYTATLDDLTYGHAYEFRVRALNERGPGAGSGSHLRTPVTVPDAPTALVATAIGNVVTLAFEAPAFDGGSAITGYEVRVDDGAWVSEERVDGAIRLTGQDWGTHVYQVRAVNAVGESGAATSNELVLSQPAPRTYRSESYYFMNQYTTDVFFDTVPGALSYEARLDGGSWWPVSIVMDYGNGSVYGSLREPACQVGGCTQDRTIEVRAITAAGPGIAGNQFTSDYIVLG
ncbi:MAG TPA: fibronectin type III domain-containing protein [Nocardioides sp.]|uniref:fibronectin type III domain-containing protein n=1 Tax=Nocardioides sp. TaxID=35761 RepID=UPI002BBF4037|nr:fibronectin type III domain-containing protein [Nocardioides sp.]HTW18143.1 fibronectin type III domain-containing protein [Nocardioides sp.]